MLALDLEQVRFRWPLRRADTNFCLDIETLRLEQGERVFLHGSSGSGKSTLLALIAGLMLADAGRVCTLGTDLATLSASRRDAFRAQRLGIIFQMFNLLPYLGAAENVALGCRFSPQRRAQLAGDGRAEIDDLLGRLGLDPERLRGQAASALSVGQQQRVAAARALLGHPKLILADEPTSALDAANRDQFVDLLLQETARSGAAMIFVSHDERLAARFDRQIDLVALNIAAQRGMPA